MKKQLTVIRYSCITGEAVWLYQGPSLNAMYAAYHRACRKELERVRRWNETMERRKANILRMLSDLTAATPIGQKLSKEREAAARQLLAIAKAAVPCHLAFYDHIIEERSRRSLPKIQVIKQQQNRNYDK